MARPISRKLADTTGQGLVELALVMPLLVMLILGVVDLSRALHAKSIITSMSREGANLASREGTIALQDIMNSLASTAQPLTMETNGSIFVKEVKKVDGVLTITTDQAWSKNSAGPASQINQSNVASVLGSVDRPSVWIFEVRYTYNYLFMTSYAPEISSITIF